jgi:hypothetical protein
MYALYTNSGAPVAGLTLAEVVFTVKAIKKADYALTTPVNAQASIADIGGGYYLYDYAAADPETYDYVWYAQYTGATSVDCAYVFGQSDSIALVEDLSGFTTLGKAEVQQEAEDALAAYGGAKTSDLSGLALDDTVAKELTLSTLAGIFPLDPASQASVESAITAASSQGEAAAALATWTSTYAAQLSRILGLIQENQYIDTTVFDVDDHMTSARLRTYSVSGSVGTDNDVLATYTVTATYDASGNMVTFKVVKV